MWSNSVTLVWRGPFTIRITTGLDEKVKLRFMSTLLQSLCGEAERGENCGNDQGFETHLTGGVKSETARDRVRGRGSWVMLLVCKLITTISSCSRQIPLEKVIRQ